MHSQIWIKVPLRIELETGVEEHLLIIADDGVGLPEDFDLGKTDSFGLNLVSNLVNQLDGNISFDRSHGTRYNITFKELGYKQRF